MDRRSVLTLRPQGHWHKQWPAPEKPKVELPSETVGSLIRRFIEDVIGMLFPPHISHFNPKDLVDTWGYQYRINRKGVDLNPSMHYVATQDLGEVQKHTRLEVHGRRREIA